MQKSIRLKSNILAFLVMTALASVAAADSVCLLNGNSVEGKIEKIEKGKLSLRTGDKVVEYGRDQVKFFCVEKIGPDGKPTIQKLVFKPKPLKMPFELETAHYIIKTDVAETVCKSAAGVMEELYAAYAAIFRLDPKEQWPKAEVIIFDKREDFTAYATSIGSELEPEALGFFHVSGDKSQIVTFKRRTNEFDTLGTLYHEATHQFITMVIGLKNISPLWLHEGLAVYFENSRWQDGKLKTGIVPKTRLLLLQDALRTGKHVHLADLLKRGRDTYDSLCYSEGWAFIYFLVKADGGAYADRFRRYFNMLRAGEKSDAAFKTCFGNNIDKLENAWKKFVLGLKPPQ